MVACFSIEVLDNCLQLGQPEKRQKRTSEETHRQREKERVDQRQKLRESSGN